MGIQSTIKIKRNDAEERIVRINTMIFYSEYKDIDNCTSEEDYNLRNFIDSQDDFFTDNIHKWTNKMIEDQIDKPFYRFSMFHNYEVV